MLLTAIASTISATAAIGALIAAVVFGRRNLERAVTGPDPVPEWSFEPASGSQYELRLGGAPVQDVTVRNDGGRGMFFGERTDFDRFDVNQVALFIAQGSLAGSAGRVVVTWRPIGGGDEQTWTSDIPPQR